MPLHLYKPGAWAQGTPEDREALRQASSRFFIYFMRRQGGRLPAREIRTPVMGDLVLIDRYGDPNRFYARLYWPDAWFKDWSHDLHGARLLREGDGCRLIVGDEWCADSKSHLLQTWLCVPSLERGRSILRRMASAESHR